MKYNLDPEGAVGEDGSCDYCVKCGPEASYLSDDEVRGGEREVKECLGVMNQSRTSLFTNPIPQPLVATLDLNLNLDSTSNHLSLHPLIPPSPPPPIPHPQMTDNVGFGDDDDAPVTALTMLCCERCPRAYHAKCCLKITDMITQDPTTYRMPSGEWICVACKEADEKKANPPQKKPKVSKPKAPKAIQNSFKNASKSKQQTLTGLVTGGVKMPKKIITEVKLPDPKALTALDLIKRR